MSFKLQSPFTPTGDQPMAIEQLVQGVQAGDKAQVLLGVTGSGKTFTMANVIAELNRPTLILTHNKTLTAQLYGEFKDFFPDNAVEYFVSYYDYYQPEAYISVTDTFIEKDLSINEEVDKLRLRATSSLLSGRQDIIIVASVSCIYGMGNPEDYKSSIIRIKQGEQLSRNSFLYNLVESLYSRTETDFRRATFRVRGDTVDINLPYVDYGYRVTFFGDEIESIERIEIESGKRIEGMEAAAIFPANLYVAPKDRIHQIIRDIEDELYEQEKDRYIEPAALLLRVITIRRVDPITGDPQAGAEAKLAALQEAMAAGDQPFSELAKTYSDDSFAKEGGLWGWRQPRDYLQTIREAVEPLQPGETSGVIETEAAWYILHVEDRREETTKSFEEVRDEIEGAIRQKEAQKLRDQWIERLRRKHYVHVYDGVPNPYATP